MGQHRFGMEEVIDEVDNRSRLMHLVDRRTKLRAPADPMRKVRRELLHPARYLSVNGIVIAARTTRSNRSTRGRSRSSPEPPLHFTTLFTGHPKLISRISNPKSWQTRAASAITAGSDPKSCAEMGCS